MDEIVEDREMDAKKAILLSLMVFVVSSFCYQAQADIVAEANLVGWWKFDGGEGDIAYDWAGNNHGTVYGAQWTTG
ncbi:MAG: hypothetical protein ACYS21_04130 [Planctomycetota bacterium]|jgi:hypothetical protein